MTQPVYPRIGLFIDGKWEYDHPTGPQVRNPSNEAVLACVPLAGVAELDRALDAAQKGFLVWRDTPPEARAALMHKAVALVRERRETIAQVITLELGKPIADSRYEVDRACTIMEWDAAEALRLYGRINPSGPGLQQMVLRQPIGPVAAFTPWNAPLGSPSRKISGAIAAGCSIVVKAAEETPGAACAYVQCFADAGLPPGVLNLVFGDPAQVSAHLIASPVIRVITFTGSIAVGKHLTQLAAKEMKPAIMELGGHAPVIVCDDVDPVRVGHLAGAAQFRMAGQICVSPTRFIVHEAIYAPFVKAFAEAAGALKVGDGMAGGVQMGPMANGRRLAAIEELVEEAVACGARVASGGKRIGDRGFFYAPTVLADVPRTARAMSVEPFGPLGLCVPAASLDDAITLANSLPVGLAGYAFTNSVDAAERLGRSMECGIMSINHFGGPAADMPFGGVKQSGMGREGGHESLDAYTTTKMVSLKTARV